MNTSIYERLHEVSAHLAETYCLIAQELIGAAEETNAEAVRAKKFFDLSFTYPLLQRVVDVLGPQIVLDRADLLSRAPSSYWSVSPVRRVCATPLDLTAELLDRAAKETASRCIRTAFEVYPEMGDVDFGDLEEKARLLAKEFLVNVRAAAKEGTAE